MVLNEKTLDQWLAAQNVLLPDDVRHAIMETYGNEPGPEGRTGYAPDAGEKSPADAADGGKPGERTGD